LRRPCRLKQQRTAAVLVIVTVYGDAIVLLPALVVAVGLGLAFVPVTIAAVTGTRPDEAGRDQAVALSEGLQTAFLVGAGFALVGAIERPYRRDAEARRSRARARGREARGTISCDGRTRDANSRRAPALRAR
jgi:hypothetical protein